LLIGGLPLENNSAVIQPRLGPLEFSDGKTFDVKAAVGKDATSGDFQKGTPSPGGAKGGDTTASSGKSLSVGGFGVARELTERPVTAVVLHLFLVLLDLLLHPVHRLVERCLPVRTFAVGHEVMLMLCVDKDFAFHQVGREIEREVDRRHSFKIRQKLFSFPNDGFLNVGPKTSMSTSDLNLH
jgi:hypothetical protein